MIGLWLADYGRSALILLFALCLGYPIVRRILRGLVAGPLAVLTGLAALSLVVCALSWLHIFTAPLMIAVAAIAAAISAWYLRIDFPRWRAERRPARRGLWVCAAVLAIVLLAFSWFALYPVIASDATNYHLPMARLLVEHHGFHYDPYIRYDFFPQVNEALFAVMLLMTHNATASGALEYCILATAAVSLLFWFAGSERNLGAGFFASLVVLASPVVIWAGTVPFNDVGTLAFLLGGTLAGLEVAADRVAAIPGFALMGALLGASAASKYTGIAYGLCAFIAVYVAAGRRRADLVTVLAAMWGVLLTALPWYAWTLHVTGDPVYPFSTSLFGNQPGLWTANEIAYQYRAFRGVAQSGPGAIFSRDIQYLLGNVLFNTGPDRSPLSWWLGSGFLGFLIPAARRDRTFLGLALAIVLAFTFTLFNSSDPRYLVPVAGLCALLAGLALDRFLGLLAGRGPQWLRDLRLVPVWCLAACAITLFSSVGYVLWWANSSTGVPPTSASKVTQYLGGYLPCYDAVEYLNHHYGDRYVAWGTECESTQYYAKGVLISDVFSTGSVLRVLEPNGHVPVPPIFWARLAPFHVGWLILPTGPSTPRSVITRGGLFRFVGTVGSQDLFQVRQYP